MAPGSTCEIRCRLPYAGGMGLATCPPDNTDPEGEAFWTKPLCSFFECPDPAVHSRNYTQDPGSPVGWRCSEGMNGIAAKRCESAPSLPMEDANWPACEVQEGFLSGCGIPQSCVPLEATEVWDSCVLDNSHCGEMVPNSFCEVRCRPPYVGAPTFARCPTFNIDPYHPVDWVPPTCVLDCPMPDPMPEGYELARQGEAGVEILDEWRCAPGYIGQAVSRCVFNNDTECGVGQVLSGCLKLEPCVLPSMAHCSVNFSECLQLGPGESCSVTCKASYAGFIRPVEEDEDELNASNFSNYSNGSNGSFITNMSNATYDWPSEPPLLPVDAVIGLCPAENTIAGREFDMPELICVFEDCIDPHPIPEPYMKVQAANSSEDMWSCAPGFAGNATATCVMREDCVGEYELSECLPVAPCGVPVVDLCLFQAGAPGMAICPQMNTETGYISLTASLPASTWKKFRSRGFGASVASMNDFDLFASTGYASCEDAGTCPGENATGWTCAAGYGGNATTTCLIDAENNCSASYVFSGCSPLTICAGMQNPDLCRYIHSCIPGLLPGEQCEFRCKPPSFLGDPTTGTCPIDNTDPLRPPVVPVLPSCEPQCTEPAEPPQGYNRSGALWTCADGYLGSAVPSCAPDRNCVMRFTLSGCVEKDARLNLQTRADRSWGTGRSKTRVGALLQSTIAKQLRVCRGLANLSYSVVVKPAWPREEHALGDLIVTRKSMANGHELPCPAAARRRLPDRLPSPILWELYKCYLPGDENNTVLNDAPSFTLPNCSLQCLDPPVNLTEAYVETPNGWECNESGYLGTVVSSCYADASCTGILLLSGCLPVVPCLTPDPRSFDECQFNFTGPRPSVPRGKARRNIQKMHFLAFLARLLFLHVVMKGCDALTPGSTCNVSCQAPYIGKGMESGCLLSASELSAGEVESRSMTLLGGSSTTASCKEKNVNPLEPIQYDRPSCELLCPEPDPPPPGYVRGPDAWTCAPGYTGTASASCFMDRFFSGGGAICITRMRATSAVLVSTKLPGTDNPGLQTHMGSLGDVCDYDTSNCSLVPAGGTCQVFCRVPMGGGPAIGHCPSTNTDPNTYVDVQMPNCFLDCPIPEELPSEYNISYTAVRADGLAVSTFSTDPLSGRRARIEREGYFICAELHAGNLTVSCSIDLNCQWRIEFAGCKPTVACKALDLNTPPCGLIGPGCDVVVAGRSCEASCAAPCTGEPSTLSCPLGNTDSEQMLAGKMPQCVTECDFVPPGYRRHKASWDGWECAEGYVGAARVSCVPSGPGRVCDTEILLEGCDEMLPCGAGVYDACKYDLSDCMNVPSLLCAVARSETCTIRCRYPYTGPDFNATCASENIAANAGLVWDPDQCVLADCPDPNVTEESSFESSRHFAA
ncbi:unnamed protein product [Symbiodinium natans]|uniref:Uncharacterized protein n=1 Tax=Symbiodinium natans TaxID=878477 RepID=A0A812IIU4_9DINO|nr:unnamed protein product [Symbiodinium natans]